MSCSTHNGGNCTEYCIPCGITLSRTCSEDNHSQHEVVNLYQYLEEKRNDVSMHEITIREKLLPFLYKELEFSRQTAQQYQASVSTVTTKARERANLMKQVIDLVLDSHLNEIQNLAQHDLDNLTFRQMEIEFQIEDLEKATAAEHDQAECDSDIQIIGKERELRQKIDICSVAKQFSPPLPKFVQGIEDMIPDIGRLLGRVEKVGTENDAVQKKAASDVKVHVLNSIPCARSGHKVTSICQTSSNDAIVAYSTQKCLDYFDRNGRKLKTKKINFDVHDLTMNCDGDVFLTPNDGSHVYKLESRGNPIALYDAAPYRVFGLCALRDNTIAIALSKPDDGMLSIINERGKLLESIQSDNSGRKLFKKPYRICKSTNGDLVISDSSMKTITGIDARKKPKFQYTGGPEAKNFLPIGVACDVMSRFIVCNWKGNSVHLLSSSGDFLRLLLSSKENVTYPFAVSVDVLGRLWVGNKEKVTLIKYVK